MALLVLVAALSASAVLTATADPGTSVGAAATALRRTSTPARLKPTARKSSPLPALVVTKPSDEVFLDLHAATLEWLPVKAKLNKDEYYIITLSFKHNADTWIDRAYTRKTSWKVVEHAYLMDIAPDLHFTWSVQLIRQTGKDRYGVPTGVAVSQPSKERRFYLNRLGGGTDGGGGPPAPPPTPDCGAYCPFYAEKPHAGGLALVLASLGASFVLGFGLVVGRPVLPRAVFRRLRRG